LRVVLQHVQAEVGAVFAAGPEPGVLVPVAARCVAMALTPVRDGEGLVGQCAQDRATLVWRDMPAQSPFAVGLGADQAPARSVAAMPLVLGGELLGVLVAASLRDFDDDAVSFLEAAAAVVAVGLMNARAYEEVQQLLTRLQQQSEQIQQQNEELQAQNEEIQAQNEELQAQGEELQAQSDDLQRQTAQLHEQADALRQADAHKDEFLGLLAHELRNPLTPISNCVELLSRRSNDPHAVARVEDILARQVRHMTHLVDDLLDVTRVARGKVVLKRERLNLIELVNQCVDDHRVALERAGLVLAVNLPEVPIHVDGDHTRICQVFSNLLGNAIKFCPPGSSISIDVTLDAPQRRVAIHVTDTGEGIEPALLTRIFEPFFQSDNDLARTNGGLGLGLALARGLVDLHGGHIEARSEGKGRGAEFVVSLPLADTADHGAGAADGGVTPLTTYKALAARVLLIDDNADAAGSLATLLELEGCQVQVAYTARSGIEAALKFCPDAVLCDIGLPVMDGYAFAREARQHPQLRSALLIALTGYSSEADRVRAEQAGFDVHLTKPPDYERIVELLRNPAAARQSGGSAQPGELA
jgi:signal transduction histidine kinase/ActR/RegA family two-component response regulator